MVETEEVDQKISQFDVKFKNRILEIPRLTVSDRTESLYRNLVVCEQFDNRYPAFLTDYIVLMDFLINTGKDGELLCEHGIIDNLLGNGETVGVVFNRLGDEIGFSRESFFYVKLCRDIDRHYNSPWNKWKANLKHKYFNTPWTLISLVTATLLLLLTLLQTIFSIFPLWSERN
ncbi:hypothetical protein SLEP1_g20399 [Rubroshorea leprosula]|uniref:Uncharacterized protein n=1 Tax=Rubroshorea leprosula TaxID=152421 RepID=A0AAV5JBR3_9ROSI|nr:hypothetical protein SLEP1_g20399 [Rubroshorea leprosula]